MSAADTNRPDTDRPGTGRGFGSSGGQLRRPRCPVPQPARHWPRCPAARPAASGRRRTRSRGSGATAAPLTWRSLVCAGHVGQVDAAGRYRRSGRADTGRDLPDTGCPRAPGTADTGDRRGGIRTLRQRSRWTAGSRGVHRRSRCPTGTRPHCAAPAGTTARPPDPSPCAQRRSGRFQTDLACSHWVPAGPNLREPGRYRRLGQVGLPPSPRARRLAADRRGSGGDDPCLRVGSLRGHSHSPSPCRRWLCLPSDGRRSAA
jgi:hypothetical protein